MAAAPEVERAFRQTIDKYIDGPLRASGFRRRGKSWYLHRDSELVSIVNLQELSRSEEALEFVMDWGIFSTEFCRAAFDKPKAQPSILLCPFIARLVPAPSFGDQWWEVTRRGSWLVGADGSHRATDFAEITAGLDRLLHLVSEVRTLADLQSLMRSLVDRGEARATFTLSGNALLVLERLESSSAKPTTLDIASPFDSPDWMSIESYALDPEAASERIKAGDFQVAYSDEVAVGFSDVVSDSSAVISSFPGVSRVVHDDRETIKVWGDVDTAALEVALRTWWTSRLSDSDVD